MSKKHGVRGSEIDRVMDVANELGYRVERTASSHYRFLRPGCEPVYHSSSPGDPRAWKNCIARLRRAAPYRVRGASA